MVKNSFSSANNNLTSRDRHLPDTDDVIGVTGVQGLSIGGPGQRQALWWILLGWLQLFDHGLACQIPDLDRWTVGNAQPVAVGREAQGVDDLVVLQGVQMLAIVQVPQEGLAVLASGRAEGTIGRDGHGVQVSVVSEMVDLQLAVGQIPDLDGAIPTGRHDDRVRVVRRETDARDPIAVAIFLDGVLALGQGVPQLDGLVTGSGHDLTVVNGEGDRQDILGMVFKPTGGLSGGQIPQAQGLVPGAGQGVVTVGRQNDVADEVRVAVQTLLGDAVAGIVAGQLPNDEGLVTRRRQDHVRVLRVGGDLGNPSGVADQLAAELQRFSHD